jgi:hypothetical protein
VQAWMAALESAQSGAVGGGHRAHGPEAGQAHHCRRQLPGGFWPSRRRKVMNPWVGS